MSLVRARCGLRSTRCRLASSLVRMTSPAREAAMWPSKSVSPYRSDSSPPKWLKIHSRHAGARSRGATSSVERTVEAVMAPMFAAFRALPPSGA